VNSNSERTRLEFLHTSTYTFKKHY